MNYWSNIYIFSISNEFQIFVFAINTTGNLICMIKTNREIVETKSFFCKFLVVVGVMGTKTLKKA